MRFVRAWLILLILILVTGHVVQASQFNCRRYFSVQLSNDFIPVINELADLALSIEETTESSPIRSALLKSYKEVLAEVQSRLNSAEYAEFLNRLRLAV